MRITIEYRNPTPTHCNVAVWVNGALAGTLRLRQDELMTFQTVLQAGLSFRGTAEFPADEFLARGNPDPPGGDPLSPAPLPGL